MINKARRLLINIGKSLPFIVCSLLLIHYSECCISLITERYITYDGIIVLYTPISFFVGGLFEYNSQTLFVLCVISIAIETCVYNKLACAYLWINLLEKSYFCMELEPSVIYTIAITNAAVSGFFVYKGLRILLRKVK